ncbi:hypothetical protein KUTeg_019760 [Tegillarca granosa]|uniref:Cholesterol side-chain cleavage enzyme, mitochondrial n=1 Tax=Tegillarca granosa TaxID=220873 RepID=A0ABQ9EDE9_TEGGR|nr:hypothetical protein KUTeg_019760 [Tegillarca granosa]
MYHIQGLIMVIVRTCYRFLGFTKVTNSTVVATCLQSRYHRSTVASTNENTTNTSPLPFNEIPGPKGIYQLPFIGALFQFKPFTKYGVQNITDLINDYHKKYGDVYRLRLGFDWVVYVFNPDDVMAAFRQDGKYPHRAEFDLSIAYTKRSKREESIVNFTSYQLYNITSWYNTIVGVGMLCFNKRLGSLDASSSNPFHSTLSDLRDVFELFGDSVFHIVKPYRWFRTPFYRRFEAKVEKLFRIADKEVEEAIVALNSENDKETEVKDEEHPNLLKELLSDPRLTKEKTSRVLLDLFFTGIDSTLVAACTMSTAVDERFFERAKEYIPERWLRDDTGKRNFHPFSTLPFGFGPRSCIGQRFAEQEMYIAVAKMVKNFKFKLCPGNEEIHYVYKTFATTEKPFPLLVEKRC